MEIDNYDQLDDVCKKWVNIAHDFHDEALRLFKLLRKYEKQIVINGKTFKTGNVLECKGAADCTILHIGKGMCMYSFINKKGKTVENLFDFETLGLFTVKPPSKEGKK